MKIIADTNIPYVEEAFSDFGEIRLMPGREITSDDLRDAEILLIRSVTRADEELLSGTAVRFLATATIGYDHVDLDYLRRNHIGFAGAPGSNADSVAEYVLAAIFELWHRGGPPPWEQTIGIIGVGNVGGRVYRRAGALGIRCLVNDPPKARSADTDGFYQDLNAVLSEADIVTLHVPLQTEGPDKTDGLVDEAFLGKMKKGATLINTSRGRVVDEKALLRNRSRLGGLVLDVWQNEPEISLETLRAADLATPHIAGYSYDGKVRGTGMIYSAACGFFFRKPTWDPAVHIDKEPIQKLTFENDDSKLYQAICGAYPISADDRKSRGIAGENAVTRGEYFDRLRKEYPKRLEFPHFSVPVSGASDEEVEVLKKLGFQLDHGRDR